MKCYGIHLATDEPVGVSFNSSIEWVEPWLGELVNPPLLTPGWVDLQVNGFAGVDYNDPSITPEQVGRSLSALHACGVTRILATVITGPHERMAGALRKLAQARESLPTGETIEGFHVEGPWISPEDGPRGAHPRQWVRPPDLAEFERLQDAAQGLIRLVTVAPEWPGAAEFIEALTSRGVVVSIGHTAASSAQIAAAVQAGATLSTHLGNAAHAVLPRRSNYLWDQLAEDRLAAAFIVDGIHLEPAFLKIALRAKGVERSVLVTDAVAPAGCPPGRYRLGELEVELTADQRVRLAGQETLAGSALTMDRGIENLMQIAGLSLREAVTMANRNPARVARIAGRQRGLAPGDRADIVQLRFDPRQKKIRIEKTYLSGREVWSAES
ncbi:MAG: N-acetylglucosamine-6-phosphate deacetylase [Bryobacteraceae bacterium]|nr:N-acetylglucosamine-6-phosphate deacetylase [Bryobacteraceae bacterium]